MVQEVLEIKDAKEIYIPHMEKSIVVVHQFLSVDDGRCFLKIEPSRNNQISTLLVARCDKDFRRMVLKTKSFWTDRLSKGRQFINKLRSLRASAIKIKYDVRGSRFMSRARQKRCQQLAIDSIIVPLPSVGQHMGMSAPMLIDLSSLRINGRTTLWIPLEAKVLDHIAIMAKEFFEDGDEHMIIEAPELMNVSDDSHSTLNDDSQSTLNDDVFLDEHNDDRQSTLKDDSQSTLNDDSQSTPNAGSGDDDQDEIVQKHGGIDTPLDISNNVVMKRTNSPIFDALWRGSQKK